MRILGIDPGLQTTGFGVIDADGPRLAYVASGTIKTSGVATGDLPARLKILFDGIREVTARYQPQCAAVEIVFVNVNRSPRCCWARPAARRWARWCRASCR